ncbi:MAG: transketolase, partial [Deltaproteobacteria bacterium]
PDLSIYKERREKINIFQPISFPKNEEVKIDVGSPLTYPPDTNIGNRTAFGNALRHMVEINSNIADTSPFAVFDCDLKDSVKTAGFNKGAKDKQKYRLFEAGIQEHHTASMAGALSIEGILTIFADFGVFGICETYNQHRLNDMNHSNLKLICTHLGIDVGEDGKTHHCIDYIGIMRNLFGFKICIPADPNQTDRIFRYICKTPGNFLLGMGRSRNPIILTEKGDPFFGDGYVFEYGKMDIIRKGDQACILAMGCMLWRAVKAWEILQQKAISVMVLNVSCPLEIDLELLRIAAQTGLIITYEDHNINTGLGSIVAEILLKHNIRVKLKKLGIPYYAPSGKPDELFEVSGLGINRLVEEVEKEVRLNV